MMIKNLSHQKRDPDGNAALEFALVLPLLLLLVVASLDFGLVVVSQIHMRTAINAGVEQAIGRSPDPTLVQNAIQNATSLTYKSLSVIQFCQCNTVGAACGSTCSDGSFPDTYIQINAQAQVPLSGAFAFLPNPFIFNENAIVLVQ